jgi:hypothetical protein
MVIGFCPNQRRLRDDARLLKPGLITRAYIVRELSRVNILVFLRVRGIVAVN